MLDFTGPHADETDSNPNPFLDYRLQVAFTAPGGETYNVPGFFDGDGQGGGSGTVWRVRFSPPEAGTWQYKASFRTGTNVAVDLNASAGAPAFFDGASGAFSVADRDPAAPGFLKWGWLEYAGGHYLKFNDGPYWLKGGTDSPETLLGYAGFDNTPSGKHGLLDFADHVQDWQTGDPILNTSGRDSGKGIIGALNYFEKKHVNSVYFLAMNLGGDGNNAFPFVSTTDVTHFDISKLRQWNTVFSHAQRKGVYLHFVLNEAEYANKTHLDNGTLGPERKLFYRELIARFGHHNALQWNISEEYNHGVDNPFTPDLVKQFAEYIRTVDPYKHPVTVHNLGSLDAVWGPFLGDSRFSITSFQLGPANPGNYASVVEDWRVKTASAGRPLPISLDELNDLAGTDSALVTQRKEVIWPVYLSGGIIEHYLGGPTTDKTIDDFRIYDDLWDYTWYARKFVQENLPFWEMQPNDSLLTGEATTLGDGEVFYKPNAVYAVYLPNASPSGTLNLTGTSGTFTKRWYNPRNGNFEGSVTTVTGSSDVSLGTPPGEPSEDWVVLLKREQSPVDPTPTPTPVPPSTATPTSPPTSVPATSTPTPPGIPTATPTATPTSRAPAVLLEDSFDRPDSSVVGHGWLEIESTGAQVGIRNKKLMVLDASDAVNRPLVRRSFARVSSGKLVWEFHFNWTRGHNEGTYRLFMQLGDSALMSDAEQSSGVGVNLLWTVLDGSHETLGVLKQGEVTAVTPLSGSARLSIVANLDTHSYDISVNNSVVQRQVPFDNLVALDTVRFFTDAVNEARFSGRTFDDVVIRQLSGPLPPQNRLYLPVVLREVTFASRTPTPTGTEGPYP